MGPAAVDPPLPPVQRRPTRGDWIALATMLPLGWLAIFLNHQIPDGLFDSALPHWGDYLAFTAFTVPVVLRRVAPVAVGLYVGVGFAAFRLLQVPEGTVSAVVLFMAVHAVGAYGPDSAARHVVRAAALAAGAIALAVGLVADADVVSYDGLVAVAFTIGLNIAFYAAAWLLGDATRQQRRDQAELARRAAQLAAEREKVAEQAVTEERLRIARELHDVVAHHVSVMGVQAAAARRVLGHDADAAATALGHVEEAGREAITELQRLVAILRRESDGVVEAPQPTLADLQPLVDRAAATGLSVRLHQVGRARPVPTVVALSVYRIVQEALTNARRHAPGAEVTVVVAHLTDGLQVEVVNGPPSRPGDGPGGGRGLLGMRERVTLLGGTLQATHLPGGGFRVAARLPTAPAASTTTAAATPAGAPR